MKLRRTAPRLALVAGIFVAGCGTTPSALFTPDAGSPSGGITVGPTATPVPGANGPVAVVITNADRQGSTYDIVLIDSSGTVHRRVTAKLPLIKPNQSTDFPLVSASDNLVYYLDGDTEIHSLGFSSSDTPLVKAISAGSSSAITFAVTPDNQLIAVSVVTPQAVIDHSTGRGYVEDLADSANHLDLFSNTGADSFRWPVGWQGHNIIDAVGLSNCGPGGGGLGGGMGCATSYHVIDSSNGHRVATVCETAQNQTGATTDTLTPNGLPTVAGTACSDFASSTTTSTTAMLTYDWAGRSHTVAGPGSGFDANNCYLAPDGASVACTDNSSGALVIVKSDGTHKNLGRRYVILGWIDGTHLLVQVDANTLGVLAPDSGAVTSVKFPGADRAALATTMPGGF